MTLHMWDMTYKQSIKIKLAVILECPLHVHFLYAYHSIYNFHSNLMQVNRCFRHPLPTQTA